LTVEARPETPPAERSAGDFQFQPLIDNRVLAAIVLALLVVRVPLTLIVPPNGDEAFYWLWGQHPQWSYRDHGPLVGWVAAIGHLLFGWTIAGLRFPTLLTTAATLWVLWLWAGRIEPERRASFFWVSAAIYVCSPLLQIVATNVYPDHVLVPLLLLALYLLSGFLAGWREGRERYIDLYLGAAVLGLAGLAKYNAVFIGLALAAVIVLDVRLRGLLRRKELYFAAALCIAIVSPVILWNWAYDFPTVRLHGVERYREGGGFDPAGFLVVAASLVSLSPLLLWPLWKFLRARQGQGSLPQMQQLGVWSFALSTGFMLILTLWGAATREFDIHWNVVAYLPFMLVAAVFVRRLWLLVAHLVFGGAIGIAWALLTLFTPLPETAIGIPSRDINRYGLDIVAAEIARQQQAHAAGFVAAQDWARASRLAFAVGPGTVVTSISAESDQFDLWYPGAELAGKTAIVVLRGEGSDPRADLPFDRVEHLTMVTAERFGIPLVSYSLYLGTGYRPLPSAFDPRP
jgi:4-amino-4-deoxy-L-arabinose transferase-like glycosyltransferase